MIKIKRNYMKYVAMFLAIFQVITSMPVNVYAANDEITITSEDVNVVEEEERVSDDLYISETTEIEETQESFISESETKEYQELTESASETEEILHGEESIVEQTENETEAETEDSGFIKTFKVTTTGGKLRIYDVNKNLIAELGYSQEKTFTGMEIPEEVYIEAVAENGYYVESYLTKIPLSNGATYTTAGSVYGIQKEIYTKWCYLTEQGNETFEISFNNALTSQFSLNTLRSLTRAGDINAPQVGDTFNGQAYMVYSGSPSSNFNQIGGYVVATSGAFAGMNITMTTCLSGTDYASPQTGQTGTYTVTIVSVDTVNNVATIYATWANDFVTSGYQNTGGYSTYTFTPKNGNIEIQKSSSNPELTNGNSCYSLEGAQYNVYNLAGTILYGTIVTDANGYGILNDIPADDYNILEVVAPRGYALDSNYYGVTVVANQTASMSVSDTPINDPIAILLNKKDSVTNAGLSNAEFTIKYYGVQSETDPALSGATPLKTWVIRTDSNGRSYLDDLYKVSGDSFYYIDGFVTLPLGTITIQETKAPGGYEINNEVFVRVIKQDETTNAVITYNVPTVPNSPYYIYINVKKVDGRTSSSLTGATFKVQEWNGSIYVDSSATISYDASSKLYKSSKLNYTQKNEGKFKIVETGVPTGYTSSWSQEFVITGENTGTILIPTATNTPYQAKVSVKKTDSISLKSLSGATFKVQEWNGSSYVDSSYTINWNSTTRTYDSNTLYYTQTNAGKYKVVEVTNPYGYVGTWSQEFTITQNNQSFSYTAANKQVWAKVKLNKVDSESTLSESQGDATLEGAVYEIYFNETVTHPDGTVYTKGNLAGIEATDINGELEFTNLLPYKYYIVEKTPSNGYLLDSTIYYVDCTHDGVATLISKSVTVTEQIKKQAFEIIKISSDGSSGETELLEKAGFKVYLISDLTGVVNGTLIPSNGSYYTAADFVAYDFANENTAIDYSTSTAVNVAEIFTDSKGYAVSPELAYGSYVVVESTIPDGYVKINPFVVEIKEDSRTPQVWRVFNDAEFKVYFKIVKKDATTGMTVLKAGAKYRILNTDTGEYVEQWTTYPTKELWGTETNPYTTNEEGYLVTPKTIGVGNYEIIEVEAPSGYVLNGYEGILSNQYQGGDTIYTLSAQPSVKVSIQSNIAYLIDAEAGINYIELTQENNQQLGKLNLYKYGDKISGASTETNSSTNVSTEFSYASVGIEGAQFKIYANSDIYTQDNQGTLLYSKGDLITTLTTDSKGQAYLNDLYIGKYKIEEVVAGNGFVLNTEVKYFEITAVNDEIAFYFVDKEYENIRQKNKVVIQKLDVETELPIAGAVFGLYASEDIKDYKGNVLIKKDALIETATSGSDGYANFSTDLPLAQYYVKEIQAPKGYASTDAIVMLDGLYTTQSVTVNTLTGIIKNKMTEVQITKLDNTTDVILSGAEFELYECDADGNMLEQDALYSWVSDKNIDYIIKGLEVGKIYAIVEVNAPTNYLQSEPFRFTVKDTGDVQYQEYKNDYVKGTFSITKEGEFVGAYTNNWIVSILEGFKSIFNYFFGKVESVTFELYATEDIVHPDGESDDFFKADELIATITTNNKGIATLTESIDSLPEYFEIGELPLGKYYVVEIDAADGFVLNSAPLYFELIYADQYTPIVTADETIENLRQKVEIEVIKKDSETEEVLPGAIFELYATEDIYGYYTDENGATVQGDLIVEAGTVIERMITDEKGIAKFETDLPLGLYELKEVKAPDGYILSDEIIEIDATYQGEEIEITELSYEFYNEQTQIEISKVELSSLASNTLTPDLKQLEGATLAIVDKNEIVAKWVTGKDMEKISKLVTNTEYALIELATPAGNVTADDITFKLDEYGVMYILTDEKWVEQSVNLVEMIDDITKLEISKKDLTNEEELPGATLQIKDKNGTIIEEWVSTEAPHYIEKLPVGDYILTEIITPDGYVTATDVEFTIEDKAEIQPVVMHDDVTKVEISKKDLTNEEELPGATLQIKDKDGTIIEEWVSTEEPHYIEKLSVGDYILTEIITPDGYVTATDVEFTIEDKAEIQPVVMHDDVTKVSISKQDITTKEELPGAHLQIVDEKGNVVEEWVSGSEPHYIEKLSVGKYTLIETIAPDGFEIAENVEFEVLDTGEIQHVVMYDSPVQVVPKTGDTNNSFILYSIIAALALSTFIVIVMKKSKRKEQ